MENFPRLFRRQLALPKLSAKRGSFETIYRLLALPVLKFIVKKMGGDQVAAEEVFARTVSAAWERWHSFRLDLALPAKIALYSVNRGRLGSGLFWRGLA